MIGLPNDNQSPYRFIQNQPINEMKSNVAKRDSGVRLGSIDCKLLFSLLVGLPNVSPQSIHAIALAQSEQPISIILMRMHTPDLIKSSGPIKIKLGLIFILTCAKSKHAQLYLA